MDGTHKACRSGLPRFTHPLSVTISYRALRNGENGGFSYPMKILLTHEQADFDAVASLLGAYLVDENAIPVMPRRMNRNVRAFLRLYGVELPFIDPRDLPNEPVESVTLVDTQSMVSIKGMGAYTEVRVIDHHPVREGTPTNWSITTENTGATATLFVEALQERDSSLSTIEATLLLLGIYEDTGSLTYSRTTARDLQAGAFLLEHGASLQIAADFLNHPLSPQQQVLFDELRAGAQIMSVHGHTVVIASGDALAMDEELSTVAHKLRDVVDADALFLLVNTRAGVQLIARSTSDAIDVARIAEQFGGGGHERAAASLIRDQDRQVVLQQLVEILPKEIQPAITIAQIMSSDPQLLSPETPVQEAAQRMQRYGYEGFPVVQDGQVVGLLTRRAVDRAVSHGLPRTAASLMDAGAVSIRSDESIERLQQLMTETGWGQIPVTDQDGHIIGIVTRTDLLKTLPRGEGVPSHQNLGRMLERTLPAARLALLAAVAQAAFERKDAIYIVGGFVRDMLLERPSLDFDLVVEGDAIQLARLLAKKYGGRVTSHTRFGTAKWHIAEIRPVLAGALMEEMARRQPEISGNSNTDNILAADLPEFLDLISARREFYTYPSALPTVERGSIKLDLHRRDFTINTLALRLDGHHYGELHDYWGGLTDLRQGVIRVLHSLSFVDDPTRMLRAVRFEKRFNFRIEDRTADLIQEARPLMARVSGDRIRHELDHILEEDSAVRMLARAHELELLEAIHPDLKWDNWIGERLGELDQVQVEPDWGLPTISRGVPLKIRLAYILWLMRLPLTRIRLATERLKIPEYMAVETLSARRLWQELARLRGLAPSQIAARLQEVPPVALYAVHLARYEPDLRKILWDYVSHWRNIAPLTTGADLRRRGLPPGPAYKEVLQALRDAWLDDKVRSPEEERALLEKLLQELQPKQVVKE